MVAAHIGAGGGQIPQVGAGQIQREPGAGRFAGGRDRVVDAHRAVDGIQGVTIPPFRAGLPDAQRQIGFRRTIHADGHGDGWTGHDA